MKNRKSIIASLAMTGLVCAAAGVALQADVQEEVYNGQYALNGFTASAEEIAGEQTGATILGATKYNVSVNKDYLLAVTAIVDVSAVYEIGYYFGDTYTVQTTDKAETAKYYTSVKSGENTWTAADIFGEEYTAQTAMIVWEVSYNPAVRYEYKAYAKYGTAVEGGIQVNDPETAEYGREVAVPVPTYTLTLKKNNGEADETLQNIAHGTTAETLYESVPEKEGFTFDGWYFGTTKLNAADKITQSLTLTAKYTPVTGVTAANTQETKNDKGEVNASYDQKWIEIPVDKSVASVGDAVKITMDMYIRPDESKWESMPFAISGNFASYVMGGTKAYLQADKTGNSRTDNWKAEELNGWHTFTFEAVVVSEQTFKRSDNDTQITAKNEQYVLLWWNDAGTGKTTGTNGLDAEWYYKQPTITYLYGVANTQETKNGSGNVDASYDQKWIEIAVDKSVASVGDTVRITMDMYIRPDESQYESMPFAVSGNFASYVMGGTRAYLQADKTGNSRTDNWKAEELNGWHTFTFEAVVVSEQTFKRSDNDTQITAKNEQYVLLWWNSAGNGKANGNNGAKSEWYYKQPTSIENLGKTANTQNDVKYTNFTHKWIAIEIDASKASVGDKVQITMDMYVKPENCAYEDMPCSPYTFWDNDTIHDHTLLQSNKTGKRNENWTAEELNCWHTFTFEAYVIDQEKVLKDTYNTAVTMPKKAYVLLWWQSAGSGKTNSAAEWYYKTPTSIVKIG